MTPSTGDVSALISALQADDGSGGGNGSDGGGSSWSTSLQLIQLRRQNDELQSQMNAMQNNLQMLALMPLLSGNKLTLAANSTPPSTVPSGTLATPIPTGTQFDFQQTDQMNALLPLMLSGGFGGGSSDGSNMMLLAAIVISQAGK